MNSINPKLGTSSHKGVLHIQVRGAHDPLTCSGRPNVFRSRARAPRRPQKVNNSFSERAPGEAPTPSQFWSEALGRLGRLGGRKCSGNPVVKGGQFFLGGVGVVLSLGDVIFGVFVAGCCWFWRIWGGPGA